MNNEISNEDRAALILKGEPIGDVPNKNIKSMQLSMELAAILHEGQLDMAGEPYINHVARVVEVVARSLPAGLSSDEKAATISAAWLHDVGEDTDIDIRDVIMVFPSGVGHMVSMLSRNSDRYKGKTYAEYVERIGKSESHAAIIKRADLWDNRYRGKLPKSMMQRYDRALSMLGTPKGFPYPKLPSPDRDLVAGAEK
jgi:(p)ppGpp synthase/HD superfamily hydrolase